MRQQFLLTRGRCECQPEFGFWIWEGRISRNREMVMLFGLVVPSMHPTHH